MNCVRCGRDTVVRESRMADYFLRRRRECSHCGHRFSTYEIDDGCVKTIKKYLTPHIKTIAKRVELTRRNERIIERLRTGEKHATIAMDFGLSDNMISTIARQNNIPTKRKKRDQTQVQVPTRKSVPLARRRPAVDLSRRQAAQRSE